MIRGPVNEIDVEALRALVADRVSAIRHLTKTMPAMLPSTDLKAAWARP